MIKIKTAKPDNLSLGGSMKIKKTASIIFAVLAISSLTACSELSKPDDPAALPSSANNSTVSSAEIVSTTSSDLSIDNSPEEQPPVSGPVYDGVFKGININTTVGPPMTYDEIADMLKSDAEHPEWDVDSFYLVETVNVLTLDECRALAGWDDLYSNNAMYKVKVIKDLISGEEADRCENVLISMGNAEWQYSGDPIYAPGEKFTVVLSKPYEGYDFLRTPGAFALRYDAVENAAGITLYSRRSELDKLELPTSENINESVITSTTNNPVIHSQKIELNALTDFLRTDWEDRGISSHFEKKVS